MSFFIKPMQKIIMHLQAHVDILSSSTKSVIQTCNPWWKIKHECGFSSFWFPLYVNTGVPAEVHYLDYKIVEATAVQDSSEKGGLAMGVILDK